MHRAPAVSTLVTCALVLAACREGESPVTAPLGSSPLFQSANASATSNSSVFAFADLTEVGSSRLTRNDHGVSVELSTTGLEPGHAVTMWLVIFNKPENCSDAACGADDVAPGTPVMVDVLNAGGSLVGGSGKATVAYHQRVGPGRYSVFNLRGFASPGLMDARTAEIHLVVRSHGPAIPGLAHEMTHTFAGGCSGLPAVLGTPGPNVCADLQFAVHK